MNKKKFMQLVLAGTFAVSAFASANLYSIAYAASNKPLTIAEQGIFSAGGTVVHSDGTFDVANYYTSRAGSTLHTDHANVLYQRPVKETGLPMVFLHGYGPSRMSWSTIVSLPEEGIYGNDHMMFQDKNNAEIAQHIENWIKKHM